MSAPGNRRLPFDVLGIAPVKWRIGSRHSVIVGSSPLRPLAWIDCQRELAESYAQQTSWDSQSLAPLSWGARRSANLVFYDESPKVSRGGRSRRSLSRVRRGQQGARPATLRRPAS